MSSQHLKINIDQTDEPATVQLSTHNGKRERENGRAESFKCQKINNATADSSTDRSAPKLLDLHIDYLEKIFDYLNFMDLASVADLDSNAQTAAKMVYSRRFSNFLVEIYPDCTIRRNGTADSTLVLSTVSDCKRILRHFGDCIKKIELNDDWTTMKDLINQNCTKTLVELKLNNCAEQLSDKIESSFEKVDTLRIQSTSLDKWRELNKWFPNLKRLDLIDNEIPMKFLIQSGIVLRVTPGLVYLSGSDIKAMIKSVPQLHTLALTGYMDTNYLRFINDNLPMLKHLILPHFEYEIDRRNQLDTKILFKNVETFRIMCSSYVQGVIPFAFKQLKELDIDGAFMDINWIDFVIQQNDLIKLRLKFQYSIELTERQANEIASKLINLTEFHIDIESEISMENLVALLNSQSLMKLKVDSLSPINGERAATLANKKWIFCKNNQGGDFTRKVK